MSCLTKIKYLTIFGVCETRVRFNGFCVWEVVKLCVQNPEVECLVRYEKTIYDLGV